MHKHWLLALVLGLSLCLGLPVLGAEVKFSVEEEIWIPRVKMESENREEGWDPATQVFDGSFLSSFTTLRADFHNGLGGRVLFNLSNLTKLDYPEHRFGEGPD
ncbi:MAG: hypothetical protein H0Z38_03450 [Firmicutes bacterium]|nr:hypothetical protein [Bacillota bacterium]